MEKSKKKVEKKVEKKKTTKKVVNKTKAPVKPKKTTTKSSVKTKRVVKAKAVKKTNKPIKKIVESPVVKPKKVEEVKEEKWYVWLKNNIIENEEKYSKEYKSRRLIVAIFMIFCFVAVLFSTAIVDYNYSYKKGKAPVIAIKTRDEYKQVTIYYGVFYKAWKCDNGYTKMNFSRFNTEISVCTIIPTYDKSGVYVNPNGVKISKSQMNIIKNYYFDDYVYFETEEELNNAYSISKEINKLWWAKKDTDTVINNDTAVGLAIFGKVETNNGVEEWKLQYDDPKYYKCVKADKSVNVFSDYNYLDNTCDDNWSTLTLNEGTCSLIEKSSSFVKDLTKLSGLCK